MRACLAEQKETLPNQIGLEIEARLSHKKLT
jgi:hypothetical protein